MKYKNLTNKNKNYLLKNHINIIEKYIFIIFIKFSII